MPIVNQPFVTITTTRTLLDIRWSFNMYKKPELEDGKIACYIPSFDIYFSASNDEVREKKAEILTKMFFDHFILHDKKGLKALVMQLHKLGFKANNDAFTLKEILNNREVNAKFKTPPAIIPIGYDANNSITQEANMEIAI